MATKRMFSNIVIDSDSFLDLPPMAQLLYFHLGMRTDDDGFVGGAKRTVRNIGATDSDLQALIDEGFILNFPNSKAFLITHHRINNDLKNDRHHDTIYQTEFSQVEIKSRIYQRKPGANKPDTRCIHNRIQDVSMTGNNPDTEQTELTEQTKNNKQSVIESHKRFTPPTLEEVTAYCRERGNTIDPERFISYYKARDWILGNKQKMKDWKAAIITWEKNERSQIGTHENEAKSHDGKVHSAYSWLDD